MTLNLCLLVIYHYYIILYNSSSSVRPSVSRRYQQHQGHYPSERKSVLFLHEHYRLEHRRSNSKQWQQLSCPLTACSPISLAASCSGCTAVKRPLSAAWPGAASAGLRCANSGHCGCRGAAAWRPRGAPCPVTPGTGALRLRWVMRGQRYESHDVLERIDVE